jgi:hypothetical protein
MFVASIWAPGAFFGALHISAVSAYLSFLFIIFIIREGAEISRTKRLIATTPRETIGEGAGATWAIESV